MQSFFGEKKYRPKNVGRKKNLTKKNLVGIFVGPKKFGSEIFLAKKIWVKKILAKKIWSKKIGPEKSGLEILLAKNKLGRKNNFGKRKFGPKKLWVENLFAKKKLGSKKIWGPKKIGLDFLGATQILVGIFLG